MLAKTLIKRSIKHAKWKHFLLKHNWNNKVLKLACYNLPLKVSLWIILPLKKRCIKLQSLIVSSLASLSFSLLLLLPNLLPPPSSTWFPWFSNCLILSCNSFVCSLKIFCIWVVIVSTNNQLFYFRKIIVIINSVENKLKTEIFLRKNGERGSSMEATVAMGDT